MIRVRQEVLVLDDGAQSHTLVKVPVAELAEWDATHDPVGRRFEQIAEGSTGSADGHEVATPEKSLA